MSILIKGMKMPENCIKCPMQFGGMCYVMPAEVEESRVAPTVEDAWKQGKPDFCPLVEIPESHGRLIDASYKVDMPFYDDEYEEYSVRTVTVEELLLMADNEVPTVIEAEGSDGGCEGDDC